VKEQDFLQIIERYLSHKATPQEREMLEDFYNSCQQSNEWDEKVLGNRDEIGKLLLDKFHHSIAEEKTVAVKRTGIKEVLVAASVLLCISVAVYFAVHKNKTSRQLIARFPPNEILNDIGPGGNKAILVLANGEKISLKDEIQGKLGNQGGTSVSRLGKGTLVYDVSNKEDNLNPTYNRLITPRGGQFQVNLPDGTKVWLNAESSLRYPTSFTGEERIVDLDGEAYFEVAKNKKMPFSVKTKQATVRVLGTHFNIMAYANEEISLVSLLEGAVGIQTQTSKATLVPGQQARILPSDRMAVINAIDIEQVVAWKNGYFMFANESLESIMRKMSRWYDVEIEFKDNLKGKKFWGTISRFKNISEVLKTLEMTGDLHYKVETLNNGKERRVIIMK